MSRVLDCFIEEHTITTHNIGICRKCRTAYYYDNKSEDLGNGVYEYNKITRKCKCGKCI